MATVRKSELSDLNTDTSFVNLNDLSNALKEASNAFKNFTQYSGRRLKGPGYDAIRCVTNLFGEAFAKLSTLDFNSHDNISYSIERFDSFMESYNKLNSAEFNTLQNKLSEYASAIGVLSKMVNSSIVEFVNKQLLNNMLYGDEGYYSLYKSIEKEVFKLAELPSINSSTGACLDNITSDISRIDKVLSEIPSINTSNLV